MLQFGHSNLILSLVGTLPMILLHCIFFFGFTATRVPFSCDNVVTLSPTILSAAASRNDVPLLAHAAEPIRVAHKPKRQKRVHNVFYDDRGFPDQSDKFDYLLNIVDGDPLL